MPTRARRRREERQKQATERAEARSKRTTAQQLARLDAAGHTARRERARLEATA